MVFSSPTTVKPQATTKQITPSSSSLDLYPTFQEQSPSNISQVSFQFNNFASATSQQYQYLCSSAASTTASSTWPSCFSSQDSASLLSMSLLSVWPWRYLSITNLNFGWLSWELSLALGRPFPHLLLFNSNFTHTKFLLFFQSSKFLSTCFTRLPTWRMTNKQQNQNKK